MTGMTVAMMIGALAVLAAVAAAVYVGVRLTRRRQDVQEASSAKAVLDRRLASGEIEPDEYYERESALRSSQPPLRAR